MAKEFIPWVEKYRPCDFDNIVLDENNSSIFKNIIEMSYFPNLLFYGPPGTGKTTTIMNLVKKYQDKYRLSTNGMVIHLNASDERGIEIIRNQIHNFVNTKALFQEGLKFVVLDEIDYMTKNAQQALRSLLQIFQSNVRFCLICNYISKIDQSLQNDFVKIRFNQLPDDKIQKHLLNISLQENLNYTLETVQSIQKMFKNDIRSMINFMQTNQSMDDFQLKVVDEQLLCKIDSFMKDKTMTTKDIVSKLFTITMNYNIDQNNLIKIYINHIIRNHIRTCTPAFLNSIENIFHTPDCNADIYLRYVIVKIQNFFSHLHNNNTICE